MNQETRIRRLEWWNRFWVLCVVSLLAWGFTSQVVPARDKTEKLIRAERLEIQVSYAIGVAEPTSISINTFGTSKLPEEKLVQLVREHFDLRPKGLIDMQDLKRPIYESTAAYRHFGRIEDSFSWERTDKAEALAAA